ncbi:MAG: preprotein translocase subunit SecE [Opitutales bacterium]|nr:preprotein translocase subunit SecE [Opitutales bacterium]
MKWFKKARAFCKEMVEELKKASWPSWQELRKSTVTVLVGIVLLGAFVGAVDISLYHMVDLLMYLGR